MLAAIKKLFAMLLPTSQHKESSTGGEASPMEKFLIVGLGNIGPEYEGTRHNAGFRVVEALAAEQGATWEDRRYGFITHISVKGRQLTLLKPSTFMNLSGNAVRYWMQQEKIDLPHLLIIVDDIALPVGTLRMKPGGSDAGHNGLKHIAQILGTQAYNRLRVGIGNDFPRGAQVDFVLGHFSPEDERAINDRLPAAIGAIETFCLAGPQYAMNELNKKTPSHSSL